MAKRIVKEILKNGNKRFKVESNRNIFGFKTKWHTCTTYDCEYGRLYAIFDTLEEAEEYIGIDHNPVVKEEVVYSSNNVHSSNNAYSIWNRLEDNMPENNTVILVELSNNEYEIIKYNSNDNYDISLWNRWAYVSDIIKTT